MPLFCPLSTDWGDVATWVVGVAAVALTILVNRQATARNDRAAHAAAIVLSRELVRMKVVAGIGVSKITKQLADHTTSDTFQRLMKGGVFSIEPSKLFEECVFGGNLPPELNHYAAHLLAEASDLAKRIVVLKNIDPNFPLVKLPHERQNDRDNYTEVGLPFVRARARLIRFSDRAALLIKSTDNYLERKKQGDRQILSFGIWKDWWVEVRRRVPMPNQEIWGNEDRVEIDGDMPQKSE